MNKLLTQKDLAERWQVSVKAIENWRKDGIVTPVKGVPAIRFSEEHIAKLEGTTLEKFSPLEKRKLENELEELRRENSQLKDIVSNILASASRIISYK